MTFLSRLFSKNADDFMAKGDRLFEAQRFFEARNAYEDGLQRHLGSKNGDGQDNISSEFNAKISQANHAMAELNLSEAEFAFSIGAHAKAAEHIELAKTLTNVSALREKAEKLHTKLFENANETKELAHHPGGCSSCGSHKSGTQHDASCEDPDMSPLDYYDLLIRQLPGEMYNRYAGLGEKFAYMYLSASRDEHKEALSLLEEWYDGSSHDIYCYEKGMILHRLGQVREAERCLNDAITDNAANPLPYLALALLLIESERLDEAAHRLDAMITDGIFPEQALMLRGDTCQLAGDADGAIRHYGMLLSTSFAKPAAEKLHDILIHCGREQEAANLFKRYIKGCGGH